MLYTIASEQWSADRPLSPTQTRVGLFRTRDEARQVAEEKATLAVAVRYDATRGTVVATAPAAYRLEGGAWSAPAFVKEDGGVVALCPIPPALVRQIGPPRFQIHRGEASAVPPPSGQLRRPLGHAAIVGRISSGR